MGFVPRTGILLVRGIAGGITSEVTYFGMLPGGSVPPGTWARARRTSNRSGRYSEAPAATPYLRNCSRVTQATCGCLLPMSERAAARTAQHLLAGDPFPKAAESNACERSLPKERVRLLAGWAG